MRLSKHLTAADLCKLILEDSEKFLGKEKKIPFSLSYKPKSPISYTFFLFFTIQRQNVPKVTKHVNNNNSSMPK